MTTTHREIVSALVEAALQGEPALSFKDPLATGLIRSIHELTARDTHHIGTQVLTFLLDRQMACAHAEREIAILRDNAKPLC
jgi:hypothetical protein